MQKIQTLVLALATMAILPFSHAQSDASATKQAAIGATVSFVDTVQEVVVKPSGTIFLNFGAKYPDETITVIVMDETRPRFPEVEKWAGKKVRVSGEVSDYKGHRRIILREKEQIALVPE